MKFLKHLHSNFPNEKLTYNKKKNIVAIALAAFLFLSAINSWSHTSLIFFIFLHGIVSVGMLYIGWMAHAHRKKNWSLFFVLFGLIFNPLLTMFQLSPEPRGFIEVIMGALMIISIFALKLEVVTDPWQARGIREDSKKELKNLRMSAYGGFIFFGAPMLIYAAVLIDPKNLGPWAILISYWIGLFYFDKYKSESILRKYQLKRLLKGEMNENEKKFINEELENMEQKNNVSKD